MWHACVCSKCAAVRTARASFSAATTRSADVRARTGITALRRGCRVADVANIAMRSGRGIARRRGCDAVIYSQAVRLCRRASNLAFVASANAP